MAGNPLIIKPAPKTWDTAGSWDTAGAWESPSNYTWATPSTWAEMPNWLGIQPTNPATYTDTPIDLGARLQCYAMVDADTDDEALIELRTSQDGIAWTAWRDPALMIDARFVQVRVTITAEAPDAPSLEDLTTVIVSKVVDKVFTDVDTATQTTRYGTGDVRVPMPGFLFIESVAITVRSPSTSITSSVVDKEPAGARIRFFAPNGTPSEATFDARVRGY